jgi:hypothetical protein
MLIGTITLLEIPMPTTGVDRPVVDLQLTKTDPLDGLCSQEIL